MRYTKPEITILGDASCVIQNGTKVFQGVLDFDMHFDLQPAYDLDE